MKEEASESDGCVKRTYTVEDTKGILYLKRIQSVADFGTVKLAVSYNKTVILENKVYSQQNSDLLCLVRQSTKSGGLLSVTSMVESEGGW